jgi:hypothetical protein
MPAAIALFVLALACIVIGLLTGHAWAYALSVALSVGAGIVAMLNDNKRECPRSDLNRHSTRP